MQVLEPEPRPPIILTIDIGSSSVRAALYDARANEIPGTQARVIRSFRVTADGGSELDAEQSVEEVFQVIDAAVAASSRLNVSVTAVAICCFWHSLVGIDASGNARTPVFGWADTRAAEAARQLRSRLDEGALHQQTGCRFHPSYWPAKLFWLRNSRAEIFSSVRRWLSFPDLLALRLTGEATEPFTSLSMASGTGLLDVHAGRWSRDLMSSLALDEERLPLIAPRLATYEISQPLYATRWPALSGVPWFYAIGDGAADNLGQGCATRAGAAVMIGTSAAMRLVYRGDPPGKIPENLWCYRVDEQRTVIGGALSDGGGLRSWITRNFNFAGYKDEKEVDTALEAMSPGAHGLTLLPFWAGERSSNWSLDARGAILGLTSYTRPIDVLRAGMEAVCYQLQFIWESLGPLAPEAALHASGGALWASHAWVQMISDVLNMPLYLSSVREASSRGIALLALESLGFFKLEEVAPPAHSHVFVPDTMRHDMYRAGLERQKKAYKMILNS